MLHAILCCAIPLFAPTPFVDEPIPYEHESPRFRLLLPSADWNVTEQSPNPFPTLLFSPVPNLTQRCCVFLQSTTFLPEGLVTREEQLSAAAGATYARLAMEAVRFAERDCTYWKYTAFGGTTHEWAFQEGDAWVIFQIAATDAQWMDESIAADLHAIRDSFEWLGGEIELEYPVAKTAVASIRAQRAETIAARQPAAVDLARHVIHASADPPEHTLDVEDEMVLVARNDGVRKIDLYTSVMTVEEVECDFDLEWSTSSIGHADVLSLEFAEPLPRGEEVVVWTRLRSDDFYSTIDQELVAEIDVVGQIRPRSSFSSHVLWYPIDQRNDAAVDITFDVPAPYIALTGGALVEESETDGRRTFRYVEEVRVPRLIPFGFAIGEYVVEQAESEGGLRFTVAAFPGEEKRIHQRIETLRQAAAMFERALGPLPWDDVRFAHVTPQSKETGVSTPGLIVVSDFYFPDLEDVDLSDGNIQRPGALGVLVIADELSHQWNIYSAQFPNELGEGISTYTNALFVEARHGMAAHCKTLSQCRHTWIATAGSEMEFAIADPMVYSNTRYRSVVFCKTPVVLHALRQQLGDEVFFAGLRRGFENADDSVDGFDRLQQGFEEASGEDLQAFFDQWFFRAGFPRIRVETEVAGNEVRIALRQEQDEAAYALQLPVDVALQDGTTERRVLDCREREQQWTLEFDQSVEGVTIDPESTVPAKVSHDA